MAFPPPRSFARFCDPRISSIYIYIYIIITYHTKIFSNVRSLWTICWPCMYTRPSHISFAHRQTSFATSRFLDVPGIDSGWLKIRVFKFSSHFSKTVITLIEALSLMSLTMLWNFTTWRCSNFSRINENGYNSAYFLQIIEADVSDLLLSQAVTKKKHKTLLCIMSH